MTNIPNKIYLNIDLGGDNPREIDFKELSDVTSSSTQEYSDDIKYVSVSYLVNSFSRRIEELEEKLKAHNEQTMSGQRHFNRMRGIKKTLKEIITEIQAL